MPHIAKVIDKLAELEADVTISNPQAADVLSYVAGTSDWRNKTLAGAGIAAAGHNHDTAYLKLDCSNDPLTGNLDLGAHSLTVNSVAVIGANGVATFAGLTVDGDTIDVDSVNHTVGIGLSAGAVYELTIANKIQILAGTGDPAQISLKSGTTGAIMMRFNDGTDILEFLPGALCPIHFFSTGDTEIVKINGRFEVETSATLGGPAVVIDQNDSDQAFVNYEGTAGAGAAAKATCNLITGNTSTCQLQNKGFIRADWIGSTIWIEAFEDIPE